MRLASILAAGVAALAAIGGVAFAQTDPGNTGIAVELMPLPGPRPLSAQQIADLHGPRGATVRPGTYMLRAVDAPQSCMAWVDGGLGPRFVAMKPCHVVPAQGPAMLSGPQLFTIVPHPQGGMTLRAANVASELAWRNTYCATVARGVLFGAPRLDLHMCDNVNNDWPNAGAPDQRFGFLRQGTGNVYRIVPWQPSLFEADCMAVRDVAAAADYTRSLNENADLVKVGCSNPGSGFELIYVGTYPTSDPQLRSFEGLLNSQDWYRAADGYVRLRPVDGVDLPGSVIQSLASGPGGARSCASLCLANSQCRAFTWYAAAGSKAAQCTLKSDYRQAVAGQRGTFASGIVRPR